MRCIQLHVHTRCLTEQAAFWVGAFAIKPHSTLDTTELIRQVAKAMRVAHHKVLFIVNSGGNTLSRLWCGYELSLCLNHDTAVLDIATSDGQEAWWITHGMTQKEATVEQYRPGDGILLKVKREKTFPLLIVKEALDFTLQRCVTSQEKDRAGLFSAVTNAGQETSGSLPDPREKFDDENRPPTCSGNIGGYIGKKIKYRHAKNFKETQREANTFKTFMISSVLNCHLAQDSGRSGPVSTIVLNDLQLRVHTGLLSSGHNKLNKCEFLWVAVGVIDQ
eukprot:4246305-Amphidinium_carterae.2